MKTNNLPDKWCIKITNENKKLLEQERLTRAYNNNYTCLNSIGHWLVSDMWQDHSCISYTHSLPKINKSYTEITFEQFKKHVLKQKETMKTITHTQAQQIIDIACAAWKDRLATKWGRKIVFKETIEISDNDYQEMRKACTSEQNKLFDEIFGIDKPKFKVGDWVMFEGSFGDKGPYQIKSFTTNGGALDQDGEYRDIQSQYRLATEEEIEKAKYIPEGTPCLVRDFDVESWKFAYSNGDGTFNKGNSNYSWKQVQVLDVNNLPKY